MPKNIFDLYPVGQKVWIRDDVYGYVSGTVIKNVNDSVTARVDREQSLIPELGGMEPRSIEFHDRNAMPHLSALEETHETNDLTLLKPCNEPEVLNCLDQRFNCGKFYTLVGTVLISFQPYEKQEDAGKRVADLENYKKLIHNHPPHPLTIVAKALYGLEYHKQKQVIVVMGAKGSGKTAMCKELLSSKSKHSHVFTLLDAFLCARTADNVNSSQCAQIADVSLQPGNQDKLKVQIYGLQTSRVFSFGEHERNFNVFYQLCNGVNHELNEILKLKHPKEFNYTNQGVQGNGGMVADEDMYVAAIEAFEALGFDGNDLINIFKILSAILHIGDIQPQEENDPSLLIVCELLGLDTKIFYSLLNSKAISTRTEQFVSQLSAMESRTLMNSMSGALYKALCQWIIDRMNCSDDCMLADKTITVVDAMGFEKAELNTLGHLYCNYMNEKFQKYFTDSIYGIQKIYGKEEIGWKELDLKDNSEIVNLFEAKIFRTFENNADAVGMDLVKSLQKGLGKKMFSGKYLTVTHFKRETVSYDFVSCKNTSVSKDMLKLLQSGKNNNDLLKKLKFKAEDSDPFPFDQLSTKNVQFIRCIAANGKQASYPFDRKFVLSQLKACNMMETVKISTKGFPFMFYYSDIMERYPRSFGGITSSIKSAVVKFLKSKLKATEYKAGKALVFLKYSALMQLDNGYENVVHTAASSLQNYLRSYSTRLNYQKQKKACLNIQRWYRGSVAVRAYAKTKEAAISLQSFYRMHQKQKEFKQTKLVILRIQAYTRRWLALVRVKKMKEEYDLKYRNKIVNAAIISIQAWFRGCQDRIRVKHLRFQYNLDYKERQLAMKDMLLEQQVKQLKEERDESRSQFEQLSNYSVGLHEANIELRLNMNLISEAMEDAFEMKYRTELEANELQGLYLHELNEKAEWVAKYTEAVKNNERAGELEQKLRERISTLENRLLDEIDYGHALEEKVEEEMDERHFGVEESKSALELLAMKTDECYRVKSLLQMKKSSFEVALSSHEELMKGMNQQIDDLKRSLNEAKSEYRAAREEVQTLRGEEVDLRDMIDSLKEELVRSKGQQANEYLNNVTAMQKTLQETREELSELANEAEKKQKWLEDELQTEKSSSDQKLCIEKENVKVLKSEMKTLQENWEKTKNDLNDAISSFRERERSLQDTIAKKDSLFQAEVGSYQKQISSLRERYGTVLMEKEASHRDLQKCIFEHNLAIKEKESQLENLQDQMDRKRSENLDQQFREEFLSAESNNRNFNDNGCSQEVEDIFSFMSHVMEENHVLSLEARAGPTVAFVKEEEGLDASINEQCSLKSLGERIASLTLSNNKVVRENDILQKGLQSQLIVIEELKEESKLAKNQALELEDSKSHLQERLSKAESDNASSRHIIEKLNGDCTVLREEREASDEKFLSELENKQEEIEYLKGEIELKVSDVSGLKMELKGVSTIAENSEGRIEDLIKERDFLLGSFQAQLKDIENFTQTLREKEQHIAAYATDSEKLKSNLASSEIEIENANASLKELRKENGHLLSLVDQLEAERNTISNTLTSTQTAAEEVKSDFNSLAKENQETKICLEKEKAKVTELEIESSKDKSCLSILEKQVEKNNSDHTLLLEKCNRIEKMNEELSEKVSAMTVNNKLLTIEVENKASLLASKVSEVEQLSDKCKDLTAETEILASIKTEQMQKIEKEASRNQALSEDVQNLQDQVACYTNEIESLKVEIEAQTGFKEQQLQEIDRLKTEILALTDSKKLQVEKHLEEIDGLRNEILTLTNSNKLQAEDIDSIRKEVLDLESSCSAKSDEIFMVMGELETTKSLFEREASKSRALSEDLENVRDQVVCYTNEIESLKIEYDAANQNLYNREKEFNLLVNDHQSTVQQLSFANVEIKQKEADLQSQRCQLKDAELEKVALRDTVAHKDEAIVRKNKLLRSYNLEISNLYMQVLLLQEDKDQLKGEMNLFDDLMKLIAKTDKKYSSSFTLNDDQLLQSLTDISRSKDRDIAILEELLEEKSKEAQIDREHIQCLENTLAIANDDLETVQGELRSFRKASQALATVSNHAALELMDQEALVNEYATQTEQLRTALHIANDKKEAIKTNLSLTEDLVREETFASKYLRAEVFHLESVIEDYLRNNHEQLQYIQMQQNELELVALERDVLKEQCENQNKELEEGQFIQDHLRLEVSLLDEELDCLNGSYICAQSNLYGFQKEVKNLQNQVYVLEENFKAAELAKEKTEKDMVNRLYDTDRIRRQNITLVKIIEGSNLLPNVPQFVSDYDFNNLKQKENEVLPIQSGIKEISSTITEENSSTSKVNNSSAVDGERIVSAKLFRRLSSIEDDQFGQLLSSWNPRTSTLGKVSRDPCEYISEEKDEEEEAIGEQSHKIEQLEEEVSLLKEETRDKTKSNSHGKKHGFTETSQKRTYEELQAEIALLKESLDASQSSLKSALGENLKYNGINRYGDISSQVQKKDATEGQMWIANELEGQVILLKESLAKVQNSLKDSLSKNLEYKSKIKNLEDSHASSLLSLRRELEFALEESGHYKLQLEDYEHDVGVLTEELTTKGYELSRTRAFLDKERHLTSKAMEEKEALWNDIIGLKEKMTSLQVAKSPKGANSAEEAARYTMALAEKESQNKSLQLEMKTKESEIENLKELELSHRSQLDSLKGELNSKLHNRDGKLKYLMESNADLKLELTNKGNEVAAERSRNQRLQVSAETMKATIQKLQTNIASLEATSISQSHQIQMLASHYRHEDQNLPTQETSTENSAQQIILELHDMGISLPSNLESPEQNVIFLIRQNQEEIQTLKDTIGSLTRSFNDLQEEKLRLSNERINTDVQLADARRAVFHSEQEAMSARELCKELEMKSASSEVYKGRYKELKDIKFQDDERYSKERESMRKEIDHLQECITSLSLKHIEESTALKAQAAASDSMITSSAALSKAERKASDQDESVKHEKMHVEDKRGSAQSFSREELFLKPYVRYLEEANEKLNFDLSKLQYDYLSLKKEFQESGPIFRAEINDLTKQLNSRMSEIAVLQNELTTLKEEFKEEVYYADDMRLTNNELQQRLWEITIANDSLQRKTELLRQANGKLIFSFSNTQYMVDEKNAALDKFNEIDELKTSHQAALKCKEEEISELMRQLSELSRKYEEKLQVVQSPKHGPQDILFRSYNSLRSSNKSLEKLNLQVEYSGFDNINENLNTQLEILSKLKEEQDTVIESLLKDKDSLKVARSFYQNQLKDNENELEKSREAYKKITEQLNEKQIKETALVRQKAMLEATVLELKSIIKSKSRQTQDELHASDNTHLIAAAKEEAREAKEIANAYKSELTLVKEELEESQRSTEAVANQHQSLVSRNASLQATTQQYKVSLSMAEEELSVLKSNHKKKDLPHVNERNAKEEETIRHMSEELQKENLELRSQCVSLEEANLHLEQSLNTAQINNSILEEEINVIKSRMNSKMNNERSLEQESSELIVLRNTIQKLTTDLFNASALAEAERKKVHDELKNAIEEKDASEVKRKTMEHDLEEEISQLKSRIQSSGQLNVDLERSLQAAQASYHVMEKELIDLRSVRQEEESMRQEATSAEIAALRSTIESLTAQNDARADVVALNQELDSVKETIKVKERELENAISSLRDSERDSNLEISALISQNGSLKDNVEVLQSSLQTAQLNYRVIEEELNTLKISLNNRIEGANALHISTPSEIVALQNTIESLTKDVLDAKSSKTSLIEKHSELETSMRSQIHSLQEAKNELEKQSTERENNLASLLDEMAELKDELSQTKVALTSLQKKNSELTIKCNSSQAAYAALQENNEHLEALIEQWKVLCDEKEELVQSEKLSSTEKGLKCVDLENQVEELQEHNSDLTDSKKALLDRENILENLVRNYESDVAVVTEQRNVLEATLDQKCTDMTEMEEYYVSLLEEKHLEVKESEFVCSESNRKLQELQTKNIQDLECLRLMLEKVDEPSEESVIKTKSGEDAALIYQLKEAVDTLVTDKLILKDKVAELLKQNEDNEEGLQRNLEKTILNMKAEHDSAQMKEYEAEALQLGQIVSQMRLNEKNNESIIESLNNQYEKANMDLQSSLFINTELSKINSRLSHQTDEGRQENSFLQETMKTLCDDLDKMNDTLAALRAEKEKQEKENEKLEEQARERKEAGLKRQATFHLEQHANQIAILKKQVAELEEQLNKEKALRANGERQLDDFTRALEEREKIAKSSTGALMSQMYSLEAENGELQRLLNDSGSKITIADQKQVIDSLVNDKLVLRDNIAKLNTKLEDTLAQVVLLEDREQHLVKDLKALEKSRRNIQLQVTNMSSVNVNLQNQYSSLISEFKAKDKSLQTQKHEVASLIRALENASSLSATDFAKEQSSSNENTVNFDTELDFGGSPTHSLANSVDLRQAGSAHDFFRRSEQESAVQAKYGKQISELNEENEKLNNHVQELQATVEEQLRQIEMQKMDNKDVIESLLKDKQMHMETKRKLNVEVMQLKEEKMILAQELESEKLLVAGAGLARAEKEKEIDQLKGTLTYLKHDLKHKNKKKESHALPLKASRSVMNPIESQRLRAILSNLKSTENAHQFDISSLRQAFESNVSLGKNIIDISIASKDASKDTLFDVVLALQNKLKDEKKQSKRQLDSCNTVIKDLTSEKEQLHDAIVVLEEEIQKIEKEFEKHAEEKNSLLDENLSLCQKISILETQMFAREQLESQDDERKEESKEIPCEFVDELRISFERTEKKLTEKIKSLLEYQSLATEQIRAYQRENESLLASEQEAKQALRREIEKNTKLKMQSTENLNDEKEEQKDSEAQAQAQDIEDYSDIDINYTAANILPEVDNNELRLEIECLRVQNRDCQYRQKEAIDSLVRDKLVLIETRQSLKEEIQSLTSKLSQEMAKNEKYEAQVSSLYQDKEQSKRLIMRLQDKFASEYNDSRTFSSLFDKLENRLLLVRSDLENARENHTDADEDIQRYSDSTAKVQQLEMALENQRIVSDAMKLNFQKQVASLNKQLHKLRRERQQSYASTVNESPVNTSNVLAPIKYAAPPGSEFKLWWESISKCLDKLNGLMAHFGDSIKKEANVSAKREEILKSSLRTQEKLIKNDRATRGVYDAHVFQTNEDKQHIDFIKDAFSSISSLVDAKRDVFDDHSQKLTSLMMALQETQAIFYCIDEKGQAVNVEEQENNSEAEVNEKESATPPNGQGVFSERGGVDEQKASDSNSTSKEKDSNDHNIQVKSQIISSLPELKGAIDSLVTDKLMLRTKLSELNEDLSAKDSEIEILNLELCKLQEVQKLYTIENTSLKRMVENEAGYQRSHRLNNGSDRHNIEMEKVLKQNKSLEQRVLELSDTCNRLKDSYNKMKMIQDYNGLSAPSLILSSHLSEENGSVDVEANMIEKNEDRDLITQKRKFASHETLETSEFPSSTPLRTALSSLTSDFNFTKASSASIPILTQSLSVLKMEVDPNEFGNRVLSQELDNLRKLYSAEKLDVDKEKGWVDSKFDPDHSMLVSAKEILEKENSRLLATVYQLENDLSLACEENSKLKLLLNEGLELSKDLYKDQSKEDKNIELDDVLPVELPIESSKTVERGDKEVLVRHSSTTTDELYLDRIDEKRVLQLKKDNDMLQLEISHLRNMKDIFNSLPSEDITDMGNLENAPINSESIYKAINSSLSAINELKMLVVNQCKAQASSEAHISAQENLAKSKVSETARASADKEDDSLESIKSLKEQLRIKCEELRQMENLWKGAKQSCQVYEEKLNTTPSINDVVWEGSRTNVATGDRHLKMMYDNKQKILARLLEVQACLSEKELALEIQEMEKQQAERKLKDSEGLLHELWNANYDLQFQNNSLQEAITSLKAELSRTINQATNAKQKHKVASDNIKTLFAEMNGLEKVIVALQEENTAKVELQDFNMLNEAFDGLKQTFQAQLEELNKAADQREKTKSRLDFLGRQLKEKQNIIEVTQAREAKLITELNSKDQARDTIEQALENEKKRCKALSEETYVTREQLQMLNVELVRACETTETQTSAISQLKNEIKYFKNALESQKQENLELQDVCQRLQQWKSSREEVEKLFISKNELTVQELQDVQQLVASQKSEISSLESSNVRLSERVASLPSQVDFDQVLEQKKQANTENAKLKSALEELESKLLNETNLMDQIAEREQSIQSINRQLMYYKDKCSAHQEDLNKMDLCIRKYQTSLAIVEQARMDKEDELSKKIDEVYGLKKNLSKQDSTELLLKSAKKQAFFLASENERLIESYTKAKSEVDSLYQKNFELQTSNECALLEKAKSDKNWEAKQEALRSKMKDLQGEFQMQLESKESNFKLEKQKLLDIISNAEAQNIALSEEICAIQEDLEREVSLKKSALKDLKQAREKAHSGQKEILKLQLLTEEMKEKTDTKTLESSRIGQQHAETLAIIDEKEHRIQHLKSLNSELTGQLTSLNASFNSHRDSSASLALETTKLNKEISALRESYSTLKRQNKLLLSNMEETKAESKLAEQNSRTLALEKDALQREVSHLKENIRACELRMNEAKAEYEVMKNEMKHMQNENNLLKESLDDLGVALDDESSKTQKIKNSVTSEKEAVSFLRNEVESFKKQLIRKAEEVEKWRELYSEAKRKSKESERLVQKLNSSLSEQAHEVDSLRQQMELEVNRGPYDSHRFSSLRTYDDSRYKSSEESRVTYDPYSYSSANPARMIDPLSGDVDQFSSAEEYEEHEENENLNVLGPSLDLPSTSSMEKTLWELKQCIGNMQSKHST
eukprot:Nk52_evm52s2118 gene=Nk52_evmTU52s2118